MKLKFEEVNSDISKLEVGKIFKMSLGCHDGEVILNKVKVTNIDILNNNFEIEILAET